MITSLILFNTPSELNSINYVRNSMKKKQACGLQQINK